MPDEAVPSPHTRCVFVYGSLRCRGASDIRRLRPAPQWMGVAHVPGDLFHLGAYPGLLLRAVGPPVVGEVYRIDPALESVLDVIEGVLGPQAAGEYEKREVDVSCAGAVVRCLVYEINPSYVVGAAYIVHGGWMKA